jgi:2'-5' RNA ligase
MRAGLVAYEVGQQFDEFDCKVSNITSFPRGERGFPIVCPVESEVLHEFRAKLAEEFDKQRIAFDKKFPEYKPHVTLSYADTALQETRIKPLRWKVKELSIWGGDSGEDKIVVKIPLCEGMVDWLL